MRREFTMAVGINRVIEKPERRPMLAAVQKIRVSAISCAMDAQRIGMSRIRVAQFAFVQIREQVKGEAKSGTSLYSSVERSARLSRARNSPVHRPKAAYQVERIMTINDLTHVTKEVVESARESLLIGPE